MGTRSVWIIRFLAVLMLAHLSSTKPEGKDKKDKPNVSKVWHPSQTLGSRSEEGVWGPWSPWASCSRTCGGGVAVQKRECLPNTNYDARKRSGRRRRKLSFMNNEVLDAVPNLAQNKQQHDGNGLKTHTVTLKDGVYWRCPGLDKRYHECNTRLCPGPRQDFRAEQCTAFNKRPFRGQYFMWLPYIDENNPCALNCRPAGKAFFAPLGTARDGTSCDKPGYRAICVQGQCKAVGLDGVVSQSATIPLGQLSCGNRLVSGLFTRPLMPLGYTLLTTIPVGACRINITEMAHSNNYLALKITNGSFVINGNFAISWAGEYEAAGTKFFYRRQSGVMVESISAPGPLTQSIDVMILYQHPNSGIKYEYTTHVPPDEDAPKSPPAPRPSAIAPPLFHGGFNGSTIRRMAPHPARNPHPPNPDDNSVNPTNNNNDDNRPKNVADIEENSIEPKKEPEQDKYPYEVGVLATESEKPQIQQQPQTNQGNSRHRRRKFVWQIMRYTQCTKPCAGVQHPVYSCVREISQTLVPERRCGPKPQNVLRPCGGPCAPRWVPGPWTPCSSTCGQATQTRIVQCRQDVAHNALNVKVNDLHCQEKAPPSIQACQLPDCTEPKTNDINSPNLQPNHVRSENYPRVPRPRNFRDREGIDSFVDSPGTAIITRHTNQTRSRSGENVGNDDLSNDISGNNGYKNNGQWKAGNAWIYSEWTQECSEECGKGVQTRMVRCADPSGCDERKKPPDTRACSSDRKCATQSYKWFTGPWSPCSNPCAINGKMSREVVCLVYYKGLHRVGSGCPPQQRPEAERPCPPSMLRADCQPEWFTSDWSQCTGPCGNTQQTRLVMCQGTPAASCTKPKPPTHRECMPSHCHTEGFTPSPKVERNSDRENTLEGPSQSGECIDKTPRCQLAVQARLCQYEYYASTCCASCRKALSLS